MKKIVILTSLLGLAACSSTVVKDQPDIIFPQEETALEALKEISIEARHELRILAKAKEAKAQESMTKEQHEQRFFQAVHVPAGFEKKKTFHYNGKASEAAKAISILAGYKLDFVGKPIPNEPWVTIHVDNAPLNEALKELGVQTGGLIRIEIHEAASPRLMRFVYN